MISRRELMQGAAAAAVAVPLVAEAQQSGRVWRIGYLGVSAPKTPESARAIDAFVAELRARGYEEGRNLLIEWRWAEGRPGAFDEFTKDFLDMKVDVIVSANSGAIRVARKATTTVPIVMAGIVEPERLGIVANLSHPGGNVTGVSSLMGAVSQKAVEAFRELFPQSLRLGVLFNPDTPGGALVVEEMRAGAKKLGVILVSTEVRQPSDLDSALKTIAQRQPGALIPFQDLLTFRDRIVEFATQQRLPLIVAARGWPGALISYGPDSTEMFRRAATYVDRILKGANPGDLPVEQPTKFEMVINLKTAKALGITIPPSLLLRADQVIE